MSADRVGGVTWGRASPVLSVLSRDYYRAATLKVCSKSNTAAGEIELKLACQKSV